jgi:hypothetical protein
MIRNVPSKPQIQRLINISKISWLDDDYSLFLVYLTMLSKIPDWVALNNNMITGRRIRRDEQGTITCKVIYKGSTFHTGDSATGCIIQKMPKYAIYKVIILFEKHDLHFLLVRLSYVYWRSLLSWLPTRAADKRQEVANDSQILRQSDKMMIL